MTDEIPVVAYVLAGCTCGPTLQVLGVHIETCPVSNERDLGWYIVRRAGTTKRDGGLGVTWSCTCNGTMCRHVRALIRCEKIVEVTSFAEAIMVLSTSKGCNVVKLTPAGEEAFRADWAARALRTRE